MPSTKHSPFNHQKSRSSKRRVSISPKRDTEFSWIRRLSSVKDTEKLGFYIGKEVCGGEVVALYGEVGTGKTAFVRGLASGLGIPSDEVTSPTFTLIHEYQGRLPLIHIDLYRIENTKELDQIGLQEYCNQASTIVIEWANRMQTELLHDHLAIYFQHKARYSREVTLTAIGSQSRQLLSKIIGHYRSKT